MLPQLNKSHFHSTHTLNGCFDNNTYNTYSQQEVSVQLQIETSILRSRVSTGSNFVTNLIACKKYASSEIHEDVTSQEIKQAFDVKSTTFYVRSGWHKLWLAG